MDAAGTHDIQGDEYQHRIEHTLSALVRPLASATAVLGGLVLVIGWAFGVTSARSLAPPLAAMAPSTSLCFLIAGLSILGLAHSGPPRDARRQGVALAGGLTIGLVAACNLAVRMSGAATGIDALALPQTLAEQPAHMSNETTIEFLLVAGCLLFFGLGKSGRRLYVVCVTTGLLITAIMLTAYILNPAQPNSTPGFTGQALHTATGFAMTFFALLFVRPSWGWLPILTSARAGGQSARQLFPAIAAAPPALSLAALMVMQLDYLPLHFRLAIDAVMASALLAGLVLHSGARQNRADETLHEALEGLRVTAHSRTVLLQEVYHRVRNNLQQVEAIVALEAARIDDDRALQAMDAIRGRILALGAVHQMLLASSNLATFDIGDYLRTLCAMASKGAAAQDARITIDVEASHELISVDFGMPIGLLVNELIANSLKHAFKGRQSGRIFIKYDFDKNGDAILIVQDNGVGAPDADQDVFPSGGMGSLIIMGLVDQLGAELSVDGRQGMSVRIVIPKAARGA